MCLKKAACWQTNKINTFSKCCLQRQEAVEGMFKVKVEKVRILNVKGKTKRFGGRLGKRTDTRKAYVTLMADNDIDFAGAN